jgi:aminoglycoside phosphotransferase (APT) family kinase protein
LIEELAELSAIVGAPVIAAERCGWGFENRTAIATLADGRRLVVQRLASRALAGRKLQLADTLPPRLAAVGIRAPRQLAANPNADPPYAVREYLPGEPGATHMGTIEGAIQIARAMGALLPRLATVATADLELDTNWADPAGLAEQSRRRIARCRALLDAPIVSALEATIAELPAHFAGRTAVFAHGDFCPVNVLIGEARGLRLETSDLEQASSLQSPASAVVGLLDLEFARVADPLFDAAWWGWVVRYHHPARWVAAWPHLLAAAGMAPDAVTTARVQALQRLRCLEMVDYHAHERSPESAAMWIERLGTTLEWD